MGEEAELLQGNTLLGNKLGNIRKQIVDFWEQGNKPTKEQVPPTEECVALYPGSQSIPGSSSLTISHRHMT